MKAFSPYVYVNTGKPPALQTIMRIDDPDVLAEICKDHWRDSYTAKVLAQHRLTPARGLWYLIRNRRKVVYEQVLRHPNATPALFKEALSNPPLDFPNGVDYVFSHPCLNDELFQFALNISGRKVEDLYLEFKTYLTCHQISMVWDEMDKEDVWDSVTTFEANGINHHAILRICLHQNVPMERPQSYLKNHFNTVMVEYLVETGDYTVEMLTGLPDAWLYELCVASNQPS